MVNYGTRLGVNVKDSDDVPYDAISTARPQALYIVPVQRRFMTQQQFQDDYKSYYKQTKGGVGLMEQRKAQGLPPHKPHKPHNPHKYKVKLDHAFAARSGGGPKSRFNVMLSNTGRSLWSLVSSLISLVGRKPQVTSSSGSNPSLSCFAPRVRRL